MTESERQDTKLATIYELRLLITSSNKESYTVEELTALLDTIAQTKDQK